ncbi:hypothetical protein [Reichenbachiella sp. 5M10]|uniref:hypothetical protein n=1 Tax=Reichenbachiella sp. 5M10 TaxID=1889772 RepID=UPI00117B2EE3|nr:hypothetical protein [Reichenbachiella sp. 5M10]
MSNYIKFLLIALCGMASTQVQAQKLKYKNIFELIEAGDYDTAIPMTREFLSDEKNADEANANLQMALFYDRQVSNYHLIEDSTAILKAADSALYFLMKSKDLIDEKELKKNDDYYQAYYRRDLRTGEFGIKLSDVQLDLDKKIESTKNIVDYASDIYSNLFKINAYNTFCMNTYTGFVKQYPTVSEFYLRTGQDQLDQLDEMIARTTDIRDGFERVRQAVSMTGAKGYSPELTFKVIRTYGQDGMSEVDFFANDVQAWDYGVWAEENYSKIKREVLSMKAELIEFDKELKAEYESLKGLYTMDFSSLIKQTNPRLVSQMRELDPDPIPIKLFDIQIKTNQYQYITTPLQNARIENEEDVDYQVMISDSLLSILDHIEMNAETLVEPYVTEGKLKYPELIEGEYGGDFGLIKLRQKMESFVSSARSKWEDRNQTFVTRSHWGVSPDGADSLYLPTADDMEAPRYLSDYYSVATLKDDSSNTYVIGLEFKGSVDVGFIAKVNNGRLIEWKENFVLKGMSYDKADLLVFGDFVPAQEGRLTAYLYSADPSGSKNMVAISIEESGEMKWSNRIKVPRKPVDVKMNDTVKETIFYFVSADEMDSVGDGEMAYLVIDRTGNVRK